MKLPQLSLELYSQARVLNFLLQGELLQWLTGALVPGHRRDRPSRQEVQAIQRSARALLKQDLENIQHGVYPASVLLPENPWVHAARLPQVLWDGIRLSRKRNQGRTTEFSPQVKARLEKFPRYYRRNFHFQSDGYLSSRSAELYEHQVEILFVGVADAMRRMVIEPLKKKFGNDHDGTGLRFLEVAAGTGRAAHFVSLAFPKATVIATDLSQEYLKKGRERLGDQDQIEWLQADATALPFSDQSFDACYSVFLFHELPLEERKKVFREAARVVKPGGMIVAVDSLQRGEVPELDPALERFPAFFHEPFYRNYLENPLEGLLRAEAGIRTPKAIETSLGFFSKCVAGSVPAKVSRRKKKA